QGPISPTRPAAGTLAWRWNDALIDTGFVRRARDVGRGRSRAEGRLRDASQGPHAHVPQRLRSSKGPEAPGVLRAVQEGPGARAIRGVGRGHQAPQAAGGEVHGL